MNKTSITSILASLFLAAGTCLPALCQQSASVITRLLVTEEKHINDLLDFSRTEVFVAATNLSDSAQVRIVSTSGDAFLTLTGLRIEGTNIWFRRWEFGRHPPSEQEKSPLYMIMSGSVAFERTPEHHLVIGDKNGLREDNKHFGDANGRRIVTYLVLKAETE